MRKARVFNLLRLFHDTNDYRKRGDARKAGSNLNQNPLQSNEQ